MLASNVTGQPAPGSHNWTGSAGVRVARARLAEELPHLAVQEHASLARLGRWRIGGPADLLIEPSSPADLAHILAIVSDCGARHIVVGDGSNLLFDDEGLRGIVIKIGRAMAGMSLGRHGLVDAGAGIWVPLFVRRLIAAGLAGATHAIGIPGTLGGLVTMNGGSQRQGIGSHVVRVDALDMKGRPHRLDKAALAFGYRSSRLQDAGLIVTAARFRFPSGATNVLRHEAIGILAARRAKFPRIRAHCGSVFVSDPTLYSLIGSPGEAIERAGLKGMAIGDAQFSPDHANFVVNRGAARSADVLALIHLARRRVRDLTGIAMRAEVRHVAPDGLIRPAHETPDSAPGLHAQASPPLATVSP